MKEPSAYIAQLPVSGFPGLQKELAKRRAKSGRTIVVLDDDPTGCQTVKGVPVLFDWDAETLVKELKAKTPMVFLMTNSRSMSAVAAVNLYREAGMAIREAVKATGRQVSLVSRSDSTLRGHYPAEPASLHFLFNKPPVHCLIPAFFQGGRVTLDNVHYVVSGEHYVPAAETPFAADKVFGFSHSDLREWVEEKTAGHVNAAEVQAFSIEKLREKGPGYVCKKLLKAEPGSVVIVNAAEQNDLDIFALGAMEAEQEGAEVLYRTAASFLNSYGAIETAPLMKGSEIRSEGGHGGLFVVGSHVPKTSAQLGQLLDIPGIVPVELEVEQLFSTSSAAYIEGVSGEVDHRLDGGDDVVLFTSRKLMHAADRQKNLEIGSTVSAALMNITGKLKSLPSFIVAKGGITSHVVASDGLKIRRAVVAGQALPGVPVLVPDDRPGTRYVVFPGNVGGDDALAELYRKLKGEWE